MKVLFLAPHPDDIEVYACGTALKHSNEGDEIVEMILSRGEKSAADESIKGSRLAEIREQEGKKGAEIIGMNQIFFLNFEDIGISATEDKSSWWTFSSAEIDEENYKIIKKAVLEVNPDLIYSPSHKRSPYRHKDHLATGKMMNRLCKETKNPPLLRLYHAICPNKIIDVSKYIEEIQKARDIHKSQQFMLQPLEPILGAYSRFLGLKKGCKYAEGFIEIDFP